MRASPSRGAAMELKAAPRQPLGKRSRRLAREGKVPAIVYGYNTEPTPVTLDRLEFQKVFVKSGRTHLVALVMDGHTEKVLIREIQTHPRRQGAIHVDFYQPNLQEEFEVDITPLDEIDAEFRVSDLKVPSSATVLDDPDELVVKIVHKRELKIEEEVPAVEAAVPAEGEVAEEG